MNSPQPSCSRARSHEKDSPPHSKKSSSPESDASDHYTAAGELLYRCYNCDYKSLSKPNLARHVKRHFRQSVFLCKYCGIEFPTRKRQKSHLHSLHKGDKPFKCKICEKRYTQLANLERHLKVGHKGKRNSRCRICKRGFIFEEDLKKHMPYHYTGGLVKCSASACKCQFLNIEDLELHMTEEHTPIPCRICKEVFWKLRVLEEHMVEEHPVEKKFICIICDESFESTKALNKHKKIHAQLECNICGKMLTTRQSLKRHKMRHSPTKPFVCNTCNRGFTQKAHLVLHKEKKQH